MGIFFSKGLGPAHFGVDLKGAKAIASLEFIPRGKSSYNLLVSDTSGRLSVHLKNASLIASHQLEPTWGGASAQIGQKFQVSVPQFYIYHVKSLYRGPVRNGLILSHQLEAKGEIGQLFLKSPLDRDFTW